MHIHWYKQRPNSSSKHFNLPTLHWWFFPYPFPSKITHISKFSHETCDISQTFGGEKPGDFFSTEGQGQTDLWVVNWSNGRKSGAFLWILFSKYTIFPPKNTQIRKAICFELLLMHLYQRLYPLNLALGFSMFCKSYSSFGVESPWLVKILVSF